MEFCPTFLVLYALEKYIESFEQIYAHSRADRRRVRPVFDLQERCCSVCGAERLNGRRLGQPLAQELTALPKCL